MMHVQTLIRTIASLPGLALVLGGAIGWGTLPTAFGVTSLAAIVYGARPMLIGLMAFQVWISVT